MRGVGGPKMSSFCQHSYGRKCQWRVGGQKSQNLDNVVCERPLNTNDQFKPYEIEDFLKSKKYLSDKHDLQ